MPGLDGDDDGFGFESFYGDDEVDESYDEYVDEALEDVGFEEETYEEDRPLGVREKAIVQMEMANLYRVILENGLFEAGSARPEIQAVVENEFKDFAEAKLSRLLGIKDESPALRARSKFLEGMSEKEFDALKLLVGKLASKMPDKVKSSPLPTPRLGTIATPAGRRAALKKAVAESPEAAPTRRAAPPPALKKEIKDMSPAEAALEFKRRQGRKRRAPAPAAQPAPVAPPQRKRRGRPKKKRNLAEQMEAARNNSAAQAPAAPTGTPQPLAPPSIEQEMVKAQQDAELSQKGAFSKIKSVETITAADVMSSAQQNSLTGE